MSDDRHGLFSPLVHAIQTFFTTSVAPWPVERTLLAGGTLDAAMHSFDQDGHRTAGTEISHVG